MFIGKNLQCRYWQASISGCTWGKKKSSTTDFDEFLEHEKVKTSAHPGCGVCEWNGLWSARDDFAINNVCESLATKIHICKIDCHKLLNTIHMYYDKLDCWCSLYCLWNNKWKDSLILKKFRKSQTFITRNSLVVIAL